MTTSAWLASWNVMIETSAASVPRRKRSPSPTPSKFDDVPAESAVLQLEPHVEKVLAATKKEPEEVEAVQTKKSKPETRASSTTRRRKK